MPLADKSGLSATAALPCAETVKEQSQLALSGKLKGLRHTMIIIVQESISEVLKVVPFSCFLEAWLFSSSVDSVRYSGILRKYTSINTNNNVYLEYYLENLFFGFIILFLTCFFFHRTIHWGH